MTQDKNICYELQIHVNDEYKEVLSEILTNLGVEDFVEGSLDCDIEAEYNPADPKRDFYSELAKSIPTIIYSEDKEYLESIQKALEHVFSSVNLKIDSKTFVLQPIADQDWKESWKASFKPILISDVFAILPPWEDASKFSQKHKIIINPGMAFGTGQHETTRLCLENILKYKVPSRVLDVGTGSGILAIAAKKLGASFIYANDLDPDCMSIAEENAIVNSCDNIIFRDIPIEEISEKEFELIIANIQSKPLKMIMSSIVDHAADNGVIILSGILNVEKDDFCEFLKKFSLKLIHTEVLNDWCSIVCQKN